MAYSVNVVTLKGYVGQDPRVSELRSGGKVANLRIATTERYQPRDGGEPKERTEWHSVAVFNDALVEFVEQKIRKGSLVRVDGRLSTREYESEGERRFATEVIVSAFAHNIDLLVRPAGRSDERRAHDAEPARAGTKEREPEYDDVPF